MSITINKILKGDRKLILVVVILMLISSLLMGSTFSSLAIKNNDFSFYHLIKQLVFSSIAFVTIIIFSNITYKIYYKPAKTLYFIAIGLIIFTILFGPSINSAKRWIYIPGIGLSVQTSDFVRIFVIFYIAKIISQYKPSSVDAKALFKEVSIWALPVIGLIALNDLSTAIIFFMTIYGLLLFTNIKFQDYVKYISIIIAIALATLIIASALNITSRGTTWVKRIKTKNIENKYGQKTQSLVAIAKAPLLIPKPGSSTQKYVLPNSFSDYIFAITIEEYGLLFSALIIILYLILLYRIVIIVKGQKRTYPMYLSLGLGLNLLIQAFMHILVNSGIGPVTGQPLPFVSMGGSAVISAAIQVGILLNISANTSSQTEAIKQEEDKKEEMQNEPDIEIEDYPFLIG